VNTIPFDTLKMARKLEAAGFPGAQAAGASEAIAEAMSGSDLATKVDLVGIKADMAGVKADLVTVKEDLTREIGLVREDLTREIGLVREDLTREI
jgi:hypothetical protein